jgi:hypothetical protein
MPQLLHSVNPLFQIEINLWYRFIIPACACLSVGRAGRDVIKGAQSSLKKYLTFKKEFLIIASL